MTDREEAANEDRFFKMETPADVLRLGACALVASVFCLAFVVVLAVGGLCFLAWALGWALKQAAQR